MFKATKPFKDNISGYDREPSLRIGKTVPKNAVNLAYYYNPTATDAEKIMAAEAPRQTIDHRVETAYRYLFDVAGNSDGTPPPDDMFPPYVQWSDEENYSGRLNRKSVEWYPENHVNTKNVQFKKDEVIDYKGAEQKSIEYSDDDGYEGTLYLDTVDYDVHARRDIEDVIELEYNVNNFELNYHEITGKYLIPSDLTYWCTQPAGGNNDVWPATLVISPVEIAGASVSGGAGNIDYRITQYLMNLTNNFEGVNETFSGEDYEITTSSKPTGILTFDSLEYFPVGYYKEAEDGTEVQVDSSGKIAGLVDIGYIVGPQFQWKDDTSDELNRFKCRNPDGTYKNSFEAHYSHDSENYSEDDYDASDFNSEIRQFLGKITGSSPGTGTPVITRAGVIQELEDAINFDGNSHQDKDVVVVIKAVRFYVDTQPEIVGNIGEDDDPNDTRWWKAGTGLCHFEVDYMFEITDRGKEGILKYDVCANYSGVLTRTITTKKTIPTQFMARCNYVGIVRKKWITWDGKAFYMGSVTKGNSVGNMNPENDNEILMFPDDSGMLRQIVYGFDEETQQPITRFYYRVEADYVWLTDVFKDGIACFYKYRLKKPIYDYRGPDSRGFYSGDAVKIFTASLKEIPDTYKHNIKLIPAEYDSVTEYDANGNPITQIKPKRYYADIYCSFISSTTDSFKAVYNSYNDEDESAVDIESGTTETIYNAPFTRRGVDFTMIEIDKKARVNQIKILNYEPIIDTRRYLNIKYTITAENKTTGKKFTSEPREARILNKEYAFSSEDNKFIDRAYIVSPDLDGDGILASPRDIIFRDQAAKAAEDDLFETVIYNSDTGFVYYATLVGITGQSISSDDIENIPTQFDGSVNLSCNPDGSGYVTAETTVDTGFFNEATGNYTYKYNMDSPYFVEGDHIHPGYKVKCIDSRYIKVKAPREDKLLDSWYPLIQFGHYTRILDQYGTHVKVAYSMPEFDDQHFSPLHKSPIVDIVDDKVDIINPHMVKLKYYPLYIWKAVPECITLKKVVDGEEFNIKIKDASFSDGIVITDDVVSENDNIFATYSYLEENYVYRGYWRDLSDFVRIDLNPNIYHTYNDPGFIPSEVKPSKNLFNKVIYFFLRPSVIYEVPSDNDDLYYNANKIKRVPESKIHTVTRTREVNKTRTETVETLTKIQDIETVNADYSRRKTILTFIPSEDYNGGFSVTMNTGHWEGFVIYENNGTEESPDWIGIGGTGFNYSYGTHDTNTPQTMAAPNPVHLKANTQYRVETQECDVGGTTANMFVYTFDADINFNCKMVEQIEIPYVELEEYETEEEYIEWHDEYVDDEMTILMEYDTCLYHKIDDNKPNNDEDILIGSVYIRQDTSLASTVLVDARTRGGGVLESIEDSVRHALEPESDFYMDIGYHDGEPFQENGIIIIRLDNAILQEYGGRFTRGDVETRIKRWLGFGVYPIIEFVDAYKKYDLPQYTLETDEDYTNIGNYTPELIVECIEKN